MAEYIEREAAIANRREYNLGGSYDNTELAVPVDAINSIPAAVVLCRDCRNWDTDWTPKYARGNEHFCPNIGLTTREDWFCADGEKREES